jgi:hypothetical protein
MKRKWKDGRHNEIHHDEPTHPYTHTATVSPQEELGVFTAAGAWERVVLAKNLAAM